MSIINFGNGMKTITALAALIATGLGGAALAATGGGQEISEAVLAERLGPPTTVSLVESTALREQPRSDVRPGLAIPAGMEARSYQRVYNRDGHWHFIRVDEALGWVPSSSVQSR